ncbi:hypothetical protein [Nocardiopsis dassonvillei]|uniref:hypothetical protein n=1 Tax=Nocardiopsis dassonvillei TaxID=2014 RepID=UPI00362757EC
MTDSDPHGVIETRVRTDIDALGDLVSIQPTLAELAYSLAARLDQGADSGRDHAAVVKELRAVLDALTAKAGDRDTDAELRDLLSGAVGNPPKP